MSAGAVAVFDALDARLAPGGVYALRAAQRVRDRRARDDAIMRLVRGVSA